MGLPPGDGAKRETFAYRNEETGLIEIIDLKTAEVIAVQKDMQDLMKSKDELMVQIATPRGLVWMQRGMNPDHLSDACRARAWPYSEVLADLICQKIVEGGLLTKVCSEPGFPPYSVVSRWKREHPEFSDAIAQSYKDRAEWMHDKAIEEAEKEHDYFEWDSHAKDYVRDKEGKKVPKGVTTEAIQQAKMRIAAYQWSAEKGAPERFGARTHNTNEVTGAVRIIVETGIRREGDDGFQGAIAGVQAGDLLSESRVVHEAKQLPKPDGKEA